MLIDELRMIGQACYGNRWQSQLARAIPMTERNLRYILAGRRPLAPWLATRIRLIAQERLGEIAAIVRPSEAQIVEPCTSAVDPARTAVRHTP